jgi:hypothetical protein
MQEQLLITVVTVSILEVLLTLAVVVSMDGIIVN